MATFVLLYLVAGTVYRFYVESKGLAEGTIKPEYLVDFNARLVKWLTWPVDLFKGDN